MTACDRSPQQRRCWMPSLAAVRVVAPLMRRRTPAASAASAPRPSISCATVLQLPRDAGVEAREERRDDRCLVLQDREHDRRRGQPFLGIAAARRRRRRSAGSARAISRSAASRSASNWNWSSPLLYEREARILGHGQRHRRAARRRRSAGPLVEISGGKQRARIGRVEPVGDAAAPADAREPVRIARSGSRAPGRECENRLAGRGAPCVSRPGLVDGCTSMPTLATTASFFWSNSALQRRARGMESERRAAARRLDRQQLRLRDVDARCGRPDRRVVLVARRCRSGSACSRRRCRPARLMQTSAL